MVTGPAVPQVGGSELQGAEQSKLRLVPSVYSIITRHTDTMMQKEGSRVAEHVESTLLRMHFCRTADLGKGFINVAIVKERVNDLQLVWRSPLSTVFRCEAPELVGEYSQTDRLP